MISLHSLSKQFAETVAVRALSLEIGAGEIFGLIGPDGAGKTTTLRVIATAMRPTSGTVTVGGKDVTREPEAVKQLIGYMPQRFALYPDLTVIENLNFFADLFGDGVGGVSRHRTSASETPPTKREERKERIERLLGFARLTDFQTRRAQNLSGGMQKKLALAATLMHRPRVLLLDEPTTGVDPVSRREFWDLLTQVHLDGVTIVLTTPYLDEAERCTRVGLMYRGDLIACDTPTVLRERLGAIVLEAQAPDAMRARKLIETSAGVLSASTHGDVIRLIVDRAERQAAIEAAWQANGIAFTNLRAVRPRLEDVFILMLQKK